MKKTDFNVLKELSIADLQVKAESFRKDLADLVLAVSDKTNKGKDVKLAFKKRKDLAQVLTVISQKRLLEQLGSNQKPNRSVIASEQSERSNLDLNQDSDVSGSAPDPRNDNKRKSKVVAKKGALA